MNSISEIPLIQKLRDSFVANEPIYLVGGAIRDHLMGKEISDIDLTCKHGIEIGRSIADQYGFALFILDKERDICRLIETRPDGSKYHFDISGFRGAGIEEDLRGRDMTINAIAYEIYSDSVVDPLAGANDIRNRTLRACSSTSIQDDPLRILRIARFANAMKFRVDDDLMQQVKAYTSLLALSSNERVRDEFIKLITGARPHIGMQLLDNFGVLSILIPELITLKGVAQSTPHVQDVWSHTLSVLKRAREILNLAANHYNENEANADVFSGLLVLKLGNLREQLIAHFKTNLPEQRPRSEILLLAALFHDIEKPNTKVVEEDGRIRFLGHDALSATWARDWLTAYKFSNQEIELVTHLVRNHMGFHALVSRKQIGKPISDRHIYKFYQTVGSAGVDLVLLGLADLRATFEHSLPHDVWSAALDVAETLLDGYFNRHNLVIEPALLLDGSELMRDFDLPPGPLIGKILARLKEEQASGAVKTLDAANNLVIEILNGAKGD